MATPQNCRISAILLQNAVAALYADVEPIYSLVSLWTLDGLDNALPAEGEIKAMLTAYTALEIPALNARASLADVAASTEDFDGLYAVAATASMIPVQFAGPVWAGQSQSQGFGVALTIQRLVLLCGSTGTGGADLDIDIRIDGVSIFTDRPTLAAASGDDQARILLAPSIPTRAIPAQSLVSVHLVACPDDAADVTVNLWLKQ
jgi:hypothetical protein